VQSTPDSPAPLLLSVDGRVEHVFCNEVSMSPNTAQPWL